MAYSIQYSGGTITVNDGTLNTFTSLSLPGRNYAGYGGPVDQNLVSMLENFASNTQPSNAIRGQLWFDTSVTPNLLKYNTSTNVGSPSWTTIAAVGNNLGAIVATSITSSGPITGTTITATDNHIFSVADNVSATGSDQAGAASVSKDINVIKTAAAGSGVKLPATTPGLRITIVNEGSNAVNVYPSSGAQINSLAVNAAYNLAVGARLDFMSTEDTQWYTLNATYG